ncbi:MAG TPA: putative addiction module antidote protein [Candidatus Ozemobacteraceae bacterium]|nr:putative addiction module antidote protein [Candidatus Ozemobacteraceae bacterium]
MITKPYKESLLESLKDPEEAAAYLNASLEDAIEEGDNRGFLLALRDVAEAQGFREMATKAHLNRESMYKMLSAKGNPEFSSLWRLLYSLGLGLKIQPLPVQRQKAA